MPRSYETDSGETHGLLLGSVVPTTGVTLTAKENAELRKELREKERRRIPFGFRA